MDCFVVSLPCASASRLSQAMTKKIPNSFSLALRSAPFRYNLRRLCSRGLSSGTSPERIAPESLTQLHSGFVHRNISRCPLMTALDQVWRSSTRAGFASNFLKFEHGRSRIRSEQESMAIRDILPLVVPAKRALASASRDRSPPENPETTRSVSSP